MTQRRYHRGAVILASAGILLLSFVQCKPDHHRDADEMLYAACNFLWDHQGEDGGWHSETHTILRGGESLTPFILDALMHVPQDIFPFEEGRMVRAVDFIREQVRGRINRDTIPMILDYPNYSAAYALKILHQNGRSEDSILVRYLTEYLVAQQFTEHRGIDTLHAAYGGWGFGEVDLELGTTGHVDISHTRRVLEALRLTLPAHHSVFKKAQYYFRHVQNLSSDTTQGFAHLDGGFFTSVVTWETNKSHAVEGMKDVWHSYATATCDGLLGLLACGIQKDDIRVHQATEWLIAHKEVRYPEGIPLDDPMQWHAVMKYYHLSVRGEVAASLSCESGHCAEMVHLLMSEQLRDGSFINKFGSANKEDDPLLATTFAINALNGVRHCMQ